MHHLFISSIQLSHDRAVRAGVYFFCVWMWGLGWLVAGFMLYEGISDRLLFGIHVAAGPLALLAVWGARKGHGDVVSLGLVAFVVVATALVQQRSQQYTVASVMNVAVLTLFAGWALSLRMTAVVVVLCQVLLMQLALQGALSWGVLLPLMFTCLLLGVSMVFARRAYDAHVAQLAASALKLAEHAEYRNMLSSVVEQSLYSVAIVDLQGRIEYVNTAFLRQMGYAKEEVIGRKARDISTPTMDDATYDTLVQTVRAGRVWHGVVNNTKKTGEPFTEGMTVTPVFNEAGECVHYVEAKLDFSERVHAEERIHRLMNYDKLTQLPNRFALMRKLEDLLQQERERLGQEPSNEVPHIWHGLLLLDVDGFNHFNMANGSAWGDDLLVGIALQLQALQGDTVNFWVARYTADQFAVVLNHIGSTRMQAKEQACMYAVQLQKALMHITMPSETETVSISVGVGFTVFPFLEPAQRADSSIHIIRRATIALAQAKQKGGQQTAAYNEDLAEKAAQYLAIQNGLRTALQQSQLRLFVQPQYDRNGHVAGLETLVRWQHPEKGLLSPWHFIAVAEASGMVIPIGEWMLEQACALLSHPLMQQRSCTVSVNISAQQFMQPSFMTTVQALLQRHQVPAHRLVLEVTESMLLADMDEAIKTMDQLRDKGVQFALDDFGTGYSSLSYLQLLPIQELKIDQSFIHALSPDSSSGVMVQAVLMVAKHLGLRVVAEGVENEADASLLQTWDPSILCQGYWYSRPVAQESWLQVLEQTPIHQEIGKL